MSPTLPGAVRVVPVGDTQYILTDGAFVAASSGVSLNVRMQGIGNALFAQTGGFFVTETGGKGELAVSGFGSMFELDVVPG